MSADESRRGGAVARFRSGKSRCPICRSPTVVEHRPFCSKRCAQIDLGRWLGEVYRAPAEEDDAAESEIWSGGSVRGADPDRY